MHYIKFNGARKNLPLRDHAYPWNYNGSLKGMEATTALEARFDIHEKFKSKVYIDKIISNDDSTMRT